ncbi:MAG: hypothetical protein AUJ32_01960 [Parcubacteria group bacterium CG1_02_40_82]|uniref:Uncharacterized protein n=4 Tax=Candidatus Portnoyibacteriota TaxID=1817913 RepID=A0A2M7IIE3_9BACT|nr:MAG: hypothetical protein AUJ32_01960 [Parcubacteria group bacterium CG1_02_40_82]PIQ75040.1 MAG: hypothetical protein COV84_03415 [Candidatus Portnoybacteria bacterium CG11_big_fil_rev_8_21_14_0_20_40_15]PIS30164.1 MAG: hypothetical protein COT41_03755 [Candidatus Portnoybacteria bacterium CG08_land_8_20_14_0_20_40_83]PIW76275.1 MAG: hypothetical protein CO001_02260 [Candidatus Portnoybacteria bacterium CG_4_8_14_3_um_filter_40_10]PIY74622.1 MAG: hypothetical protein COY85_02750 [Candidatus
MNDKIPVKITTDSKINHQDIKKALNLNKVLSDAKALALAPARKAMPWKILTAIFALISIAFAIKIFWLDQRFFSQYQNIIPEGTQAVFFIKIGQIDQLAPAIIPGLEQNSDFYRWLKQRINQFLADSNINVQTELISSFKEEAAFLVFNPNQSNKLNWAIIAQSNIGQNAGDQTVFAKIEAGLRKNFGINQLFYRQVKINSVYAFNKIDKPYYWSQIDNYLIMGNDLESLQKIIDKIIGSGNLIPHLFQ